MLVALSVANINVYRSEITELMDAFNNMTQAWYAIQLNYEAFSAHIDIDYAMSVTDAVRTLGFQVQDTLKLIPDHVMSDTDGKWACDMFSDVDAGRQFWKYIIPFKDDFQTVNFTSTVCQVLQNFDAIAVTFHLRILAALPGKYKACVERYIHTVVKERGKVIETYCAEA